MAWARLITITEEQIIMTSNIVTTNQSDVSALLNCWLEAERNGERFPVPLHDYWQIAGHKHKQDAFSLVESILERDIDFIGSTLKTKGRPKIAMQISVAGLEHLCMAAHTEQGRAVRELYRQAKAKWDLTKQVAPQVAGEVELMHLKIELAKIECQKAQSENQLLQFRHYVSTALPEFQKKEILGYKVIEKVETRDRVINESGYILNDGSTATKKELCTRLGFLSKSGTPDYKRLNHYLDKLPHVAFEDVAIVQENRQLCRDWIVRLENMVNDSDRQKWIGE